jgi:mono/diheme cytochrome c family protein
MVLLRSLLAITLLVPLAAQVPAVNPAFPNNLTGTPGTLLYRQINLGRVTNIAYHNQQIYTHEVGGANPRRWRFTDINDPATLTIQTTGWQNVGNFSDHGTHGHYKIGDWLGGQWALNIRRQSEGVNVIQDMPGFIPLGATHPADQITRMYYPWGLAFNWAEYNAVNGRAFIYRGNSTQPLADWPALAEHGVAGNSILLGNLLFITSDESNMGLLCYDISPVFDTPSQPPVLLDKLSGAIGAYIVAPWQNYLVFSRRDTSSVDIVDYSDPTNLRFVTSINVAGHPDWDRGNGLGYIQCQDRFVFADRHKIDMDTFQPVLELDEIGNNRPVGSVAGQLDASQHLMPMGNLLVSGGYSVSGADGVGVWIHDANPDRNPPYVGYHVPRAGQTNFPVGAPVSLLIHENLESYTIVNGQSVILRPVGGAPVAATVSFSYDDVLTITPTQYLQEDTTYEVEIVAGGIKDVAGNGILPYSFTFSTGASVTGGNASPVISAFAAAPSPTTPGSEVTLTAAATDADSDSLEYRFSFGEANAVRDWSPVATASHVYATSGHYGVKVQVRDVRTGTPLSTVSQTGTVTVAPAPPATRPTKSSPIALDATNRRVWVVNPDNDSVSILNADTNERVSEISLNTLLSLSGSIDPRSVAIDGAGNAWITCRDADRLIVVSSAGVLLENTYLGHGSAPMGVAITPDGSTGFVSLESRGQVRRYSTATRAETGTQNVGPTPRAIAITADGSRVLVTRFISGEEFGQIYDLNASTMALTRTIPLHRDRGRDGSSSGRGVPNYVSGIAISPDGQYAHFTAIKSNTQRGTYFDLGEDTNDPLDPDNSVRAMVGRVSLSTNNEPNVANPDSYRIDIDNSESPTAIEFTPRGDYFFVALQGNNNIATFDDLLVRTAPRSLAVKTTKGRFPTGLAPQGLVFDPATNRLFSADFMGRSVTVHDLDGFLSFGDRETGRVVVPTVDTDKLAANVLLGKRIFYQAADTSGLSTLPTMSLEGYISCASCHVDGQHDGMTWDFTNRGEGFRNTTDLRGRAGMEHGNVHWSGNFDEIQDFVLDVTNEFGGSGLLPPGQTPNPPLGAPNAGRSAELDALAAYVTSLGQESLPRSPHRNPDGTRTAGAVAGEAVFAAQNCASCHAGNHYTDSISRDVGTLRTSSGQRLNAPLTGIDTPTLLGLWATAPYFHDGSAKTLDEVFRVAGGTIYQAENAARSGSIGEPGYPRLNEDSAMHGQMVYLGSGGTVTFSNVDGGSTAGTGDLELRWQAPFWGSPGNLTVTVNGTPYVTAVTRPFGVGQPGDHWQRIRVENVALTSGTTNTIVVTTTGTDSGFDDLTVITPERRAAAVHRGALALSPTDFANLREYLLQLDGAPLPTNPTVTLTAVQTSPSTAPFAEFDVVFSEAVSGLTAADFQLTGATASHLTVIDPTHYRLRIAGFSQSGPVTAELPASRANALDDLLPNFESNIASITYQAADDLAPLSDEFGDPATLAQWQRNETAEGWGISKLQTWDIDASRDGHMRLMPYSSSWFQNWTGAYAYKAVTGDFVATLRMQANRRNGLPGRPASAYSLGGIMIRSPRGLTNAAPQPDPGPNVVLPWPPPPIGQPNHYTTAWQPGTENYIFLSFGNADTSWGNVPDTWYCEVKTTINSVSQLYAVQTGIPANTDLVTLQCIRRGPVFLLLRRHGNGNWIIENRFTRNDMPATIQLGITTYTDWYTVDDQNEFHHNRTVMTGGNPDLVVDADYLRVRRPDATITQAMLNAAPVTGQGGSPSLLSNTALAGLLGDNASTVPDGLSYHSWMAAHFNPQQLADPAISGDHADADGDGLPNLLDYLTDGDPLTPAPAGPGLHFTRTLVGETQLTLPRNPQARGYRLIVEAADELTTWETLAESINGAAPSGPGFTSETNSQINIADPDDHEPRRFYRARAVAIAP